MAGAFGGGRWNIPGAAAVNAANVAAFSAQYGSAKKRSIASPSPALSIPAACDALSSFDAKAPSFAPDVRTYGPPRIRSHRASHAVRTSFGVRPSGRSSIGFAVDRRGLPATSAEGGAI